jgi:hypothetical protein
LRIGDLPFSRDQAFGPSRLCLQLAIAGLDLELQRPLLGGMAFASKRLDLRGLIFQLLPRVRDPLLKQVGESGGLIDCDLKLLGTLFGKATGLTYGDELVLRPVQGLFDFRCALGT